MTSESRKPDVERSKRPYTAPTIQRVQLRPEESVLGFCKGGSANGPRGKCRNVLKCSTLGS
jgi:hypothetical protein